MKSTELMFQRMAGTSDAHVAQPVTTASQQTSLPGRKSTLEKIPTPDGWNAVWGVRQYIREIVLDGILQKRPMVAFNVDNDHRGWHLSLAQIIAAGVKNPNTLQGKRMLVEFYQAGEETINGAKVTDGGMIVKNFQVEFDQELEQKVELELRKDEQKDLVAMAISARRAPAGQLRSNVLGVGTVVNLNTEGNASGPIPRSNPEGVHQDAAGNFIPSGKPTTEVVEESKTK